MDDYLSKPVQLASLKAMLEKWMPVAENRGEPSPQPSPAGGRATAPTKPSPVCAPSQPRLEAENRGLESCPEPVEVAAPAVPVPVDLSVLKALIGDDEAVVREFLHDFHL